MSLLHQLVILCSNRGDGVLVDLRLEELHVFLQCFHYLFCCRGSVTCKQQVQRIRTSLRCAGMRWSLLALYTCIVHTQCHGCAKSGVIQRCIRKDLQEELFRRDVFLTTLTFLKACNGRTETLKCAWMMSRYVSMWVLQNMQLPSRHWKCSLVSVCIESALRYASGGVDWHWNTGF